MIMPRLTSVAAMLAAATTSLLISATAQAQSQAEIANRLNEEGKEQMYANNFAEASKKFREAVARVPEAKYFFNLCTSLFQEGKFGEALTACAAVEKNNPSSELLGKAEKMTGRIKAEAKAQGINVEPEGGGGLVDCNANPNSPGCAPPPGICETDPGAPECQPVHHAPPPAVGRPPTGTGVFASVTPDNKYIWTLGADIFGGGGQIGQPDFYGQAAVGFRLKGDYLFEPQQRIGAQGYVQFQQFSENEMQSVAVGLTAIDLGVGVYKHLCPPSTERLCLTPLLGAHLALFSPEFDQFSDGTREFNYAAIGGRAELGLQWALGPRMEHVLSVSLGANLYSAVFSGPTDITPADARLDRGGVIGYFGVGYTHRFSTPLGSSPFVTLE
jgi:hypothetical protein